MRARRVDLEALSVHLDVPVKTLYRWARDDGWTRHPATGRRGWVYDIEEAEKAAIRRSR